MKKLLNPKVIVLLVLSAALLAAILFFGNVGQVVTPSIGSAIAIAVIVLVVLHDEFRLALRDRSARKKTGPAEVMGGS